MVVMGWSVGIIMARDCSIENYGGQGLASRNNHGQGLIVVNSGYVLVSGKQKWSRIGQWEQWWSGIGHWEQW